MVVESMLKSGQEAMNQIVKTGLSELSVASMFLRKRTETKIFVLYIEMILASIA